MASPRRSKTRWRRLSVKRFAPPHPIGEGMEWPRRKFSRVWSRKNSTTGRGCRKESDEGRQTRRARPIVLHRSVPNRLALGRRGSAQTRKPPLGRNSATTRRIWLTLRGTRRRIIGRGGARRRDIAQGLAQEIEIRIGEAVAQRAWLRKRLVSRRGAHVRGAMQFRRNGADFPMLGVNRCDLSDLFSRNHAPPREKIDHAPGAEI